MNILQDNGIKAKRFCLNEKFRYFYFEMRGVFNGKINFNETRRIRLE